ncbi:MAG: cyclodeaminase/cyclohydrolase family protein [Lachnospiraceae bacterium]|nr:cyclodeaminase/cyclohydrolase family protein [Lachnospiraceae bacterium]
MDIYSSKAIDAYVSELASRNPVPGGGGTCALVGALGIALAEMVGNLTVGKEKYEAVRADMEKLIEKAAKLRKEMLDLIDKDPLVFEPLSKAYGLPRTTPEEAARKDAVMEECLYEAARVPLAIMDLCAESIEVIQEAAEKGAVLAVSDAGVAVLLCKAAMEGAALNVLVNTRYMKNREYASGLNADAARFVAHYQDMADGIYDKVYGKLLRQAGK